MDFKDQIKELSERVIKLKEQIETEEATKNALIMPFIQALGFDIFNPLEVVPEYVADIGIKKGEKVDYAILKDGNPVILIECKCVKEKLDPHNTQLFRYFNCTKAKFALLTNGINYRFYTDLIQANIMDEKPFLDFDITQIKDATIEELKKFHKSYFDVEQIVSTASELKYTNEIKNLLASELKTPNEDFVKFFVSKVYPGRATERVVSQFTDIVKKSFSQLVNEIISDKLKSALDRQNETTEEEEKIEDAPEIIDKKIITTDEEIEAFFIVKSILRTEINPERISYKDTQNYLGVLLDDNVRKTICRLWLNGRKKYIGLINESRNQTRHEIKSIDDIFNFSKEIINTAKQYDEN